MKHSRISLIERAAEVYDFGAALRGRPAQPETVLTPEVASPPARLAAEPAPVPVAESQPRPPARRPSGPTFEIDRRALAAAGYVVPGAPATGLVEEFRLVKRQLLATIERRVSLPEEKRRSILVTSAQAGDGKSFCAINLALSLAGERGLEVLLVDPSADPETFVIRTDVPGLSVLPAGRKDHAVPELLASERTREVLARLIAGDKNRIILLDSPPALMASPATVIAGHVGQVLVVVRADRTTEADLRETIGLLSGCDNVGLILNGAAIAVSGRNFGGYEGYGHDV